MSQNLYQVQQVPALKCKVTSTSHLGSWHTSFCKEPSTAYTKYQVQSIKKYLFTSRWKALSRRPSVSRAVAVMNCNLWSFAKRGIKMKVFMTLLWHQCEFEKSNVEHISGVEAGHKEPDICEFENMVLLVDQLQQFIKNIGRFETLSRTSLLLCKSTHH